MTEMDIFPLSGAHPQTTFPEQDVIPRIHQEEKEIKTY